MIGNKEIHIVTGAFGYSGKYIAKRLLDENYEVGTLTNSMNRSNPFGNLFNCHISGGIGGNTPTTWSFGILGKTRKKLLDY